MLSSCPGVVGHLFNTVLRLIVIVLLASSMGTSVAGEAVRKPVESTPAVSKSELELRTDAIKPTSYTSPDAEIPKPVDLSGRIVQVTIGLAMVLAAIFAVSWLAKRYGRFPSLPMNKFRVMASISVGQRERVVLFQVGTQQLLLGVTAQSVQVLHKLDESIQNVDEQKKREPSLSFSQRLQDELNDRVPQ